ncbi:DegV family protein [Rubeoparvulum massiliense]|uniref:DegV family protein n=1 Tax=Rubeoparvulum massiliense TaxID=1631346 RepID=UPI00065DEC17|nr:DegV family protein [Rubeoparvulum massiliense]
MSKIAIVTDSTSYIPEDELEAYGIEIVSLQVIFGEESYREYKEISNDDFYRMLKERRDLPTTSQPSVGEILTTYERLAKEYDEIISIHISSKISGTYHSALAASRMIQGANVHVFDSGIATYALGFYVVEAARMAKEGKSVDEIMVRLDELQQSQDQYFLVDNLAHLHRGGRLNAAQFLVGSMLKVKPILTFRNKEIVVFEKVRTYNRAKQRIFELLEEILEQGYPMRLGIIHARRLEEATAWKEEFENQYGEQVEVVISEFGPVIGTHVGEGAIGLSWIRRYS